MADEARSKQIAKHLNDLGDLGLSNLSPDDNLRNVIEDNILERPTQSIDPEEGGDSEGEGEESKMTLLEPHTHTSIQTSPASEGKTCNMHSFG
ncbi:hypothetical protein PoB_004296000 [Plakobranchus ocellatus]|uniref:Uncharacterized protein n=1 Tax=Plakobranchus ocellatus TaxID=259542 RepID=A0AAV4BBJ4_9GAST|nr:hypothetical protein PoB_004296000 [Plakobranchus ocellatus]